MDEDEQSGTTEPESTLDEHEAPGNELAPLLSEVARSLQQELDVENTLQAIVDAAAEAVPGAQHVSISAVIARREVQTRASTDELPQSVDQAQYETGEGPCLDTLYEQRTARIPNMAAEERWPAFAARAQALGVGSMLSVQLFVKGEDLGALNLFNAEAEGFDEESEHVALLFASHAAIAMADAQEQDHLRQAIEFRDLIGQAKGILMERYKLTGDPRSRYWPGPVSAATASSATSLSSWPSRAPCPSYPNRADPADRSLRGLVRPSSKLGFRKIEFLSASVPRCPRFRDPFRGDLSAP